MNSLLQDVRYGLRMLRRSPGFTVVAVLTLALGIGANTAIFSVVNAVLLRPLDYPQPDELVRLAESSAEGLSTVSPANFLDWERQSTAFAHLGAYVSTPLPLSGAQPAERIVATFVTPSVFDTMGIPARLGRTPLREEAIRGRHQVVVLSHSLWRTRFGSDPEIIGNAVRLDGKSYTVVGIMPEGFAFPPTGSADLWLPFTFPENVERQRGAHFLQVVGRLRPGASVAAAEQEMKVIAERLAQAHPRTNEGMSAVVQPLDSSLVQHARPALLLLLAAVGALALIACANIANLLLAQAGGRQREIAVRTALGAGQRRLLRQFLAESMLLAGLGGAAGVLLASWTLTLLTRFGPSDIPRLEQISMDGTVLAFTALLTLLTAFLFGAAPARRLARAELNEILKSGRTASLTRGSRRLQRVLVTAEVALSLTLLVGAGLLLRSFMQLQGVEPGFDPRRVLTFQAPLPVANYGDSATIASFYQRLLERLGAVPGVESVGTIFPLPMSGSNFYSTFTVEGETSAGADEPAAQVRVADGGYFRALRIPLLRGRLFDAGDTLTSPRVLLVSRAAGEKFWPGQDPIGKKLRFGARPGFERLSGEIVGIVGDVRHAGLEEEFTPMFYAATPQAGVDVALVARTAVDPAALATPVRAVFREVDPEVPVAQLLSMEEVMGETLERRRFTLFLLALFAALALVLAMVGIYGVVAYSVSRRTQEIGVRLAFGAERRHVLQMVLAEALGLALGGVALGVPAALILGLAARSLLFNVSGADPATFLVVAVLMVAVAAMAALVPARRATKVDPMVALRYE